MSVKASVIVPTYRDWDALALCLGALSAQDLDPAAFEVIVADNNAQGAVPSDLPLGPNMRLIAARRPGSYAARNVALGEARGGYVFFTDADCRPAPHWLSRGLALFAAKPGRRRIAGGILVVPRHGEWNGWGVFDRTFRLRQDQYVLRGTAATANLAVERSVFDAVGLFDESCFSGQDMQWNRMASLAGIPIEYDPKMSVTHPARETFEECATKVRRIAGARYIAKADRPFHRRLPRLKYLLPSVKCAREIWRYPEPAPMHAKLAALLCDYRMGWVYNAEIIRLGLFGATPSRK